MLLFVENNILARGGETSKNTWEVLKFCQFGLMWLFLVLILITLTSAVKTTNEILKNNKKQLDILENKVKDLEITTSTITAVRPDEEITQAPEDIVWPDV